MKKYLSALLTLLPEALVFTSGYCTHVYIKEFGEDRVNYTFACKEPYNKE